MDFNKNQPIYLQIADYINENILMENWNEGDRIQSVRDLSAKLQVNPNTVMRTFSHLQNEGILFNQRGIGYFICEGAIDKIRSFKKEHFVEVELPEVFRTGKLLGISPEELCQFYSEYNEEI